MTTNISAVGPVRFQRWELRPQQRTLLVDGRPVTLGGRAYDVLLTLVEHRGRMVSKEELLDAVWPGQVVEENNVSVQIAALRRVLGAEAIATVAGRGYQLSAVPLGAPAPASSATSPAPSPIESPELLGRQQDLCDVLDGLASGPLTTIVGMGGVGKTTLAREVFARRCALLQQPGCWVDLSPIREPRQLLSLLAKSLGIELKDSLQEADGLAAALSHMTAFVVLDNCEHLLAEIARFVQLAIEAAPGIRWLATSQQPLDLPRETIYRLDPLAVPVGRLSALQALEYGSVALLCKRVAEVDRRFRLDEDNLQAVIALCRQLEGLPLAIEMAAGRVATFGLDEVLQRLGHRLQLLTASRRPGSYRHGTLEGTYDWSYGLLSEREKAVFRRLEPFLGGFRAGLVEEVASDPDGGGIVAPGQAFDLLEALVRKSLVQRSSDGPGRFHLLESARDYARLRLHAAGETEAVRRRHARAVAALLAEAHGDADRMTDAQWLRKYAPERHNARAAMAWACEARAPDELAQLVAALALLDSFLCGQAEIMHNEVPLGLLAEASPRLRALAYLELSWVHYSNGSHELGVHLAQQAFEIFSARQDTAFAYRALAQLTRLHEARHGATEAALAAWARLQEFDAQQVPLRTHLFCAVSAGLAHRPELTVEHLQALRRLAEDAHFDAIAAICGCNLTDKLLIDGRNEEAVALADRLLHTGNRLPRADAFILHNKAVALIRLGRGAEAYEPGQLAFQAMPGVAHFLVDTFALAFVREGHFADAAVLHGCGTHIRETLGERPGPSEAASIDETAACLQQQLSLARRRELMSLGATMTATQALAFSVFPREQRLRAKGVLPAGVPGPSSSAGAP